MSVEGWLSYLYTLCSDDSKTQEALAYIDSMVANSGKVMINRVLADVDFARVNPTALVRFLLVTMPIRKELPAREDFYQRAYPHLRKSFRGPARKLLESWR